MAVTKIWPVRGDIGKPLEYVKNEEKTEKHLFVSGINCNPDIARDQFITVKKQYNKDGGIIAYHGYQSFDEGEVTPELAHEIGIEFAEKVWGDDYQVIVATHLNTKHLHNHFVVNSVSFKHGKRLRKKQWYEINRVSDDICRAHGLSVIEKPKGKALPYKLHAIEKEGGDSRLNVARRAVDEAIAVSANMKEFEIALKSMGYRCNFDINRKYWTIRYRSWEKVMRLQRLGDAYTNDMIRERIANDTNSKLFVVFQKTVYRRKQYRFNTRENKLKKIGGLKGLYLHYCYLLGYLPRYNHNPIRVSSLIRDDLTKIDKISEEAKFLSSNNITDRRNLEEYITRLDKSISEKSGVNAELYKISKRKMKEDNRKEINNKRFDVKEDLKRLRKEKRIAERINLRSVEIENKIKYIEKERMVENERRR